MNSLILEKDTATAEKFFAKCGELKPLFEKFPEAAEGEIAEDWVKMGCYFTYRLAGMEHSLAAMQACRRGPRMKNSDRTFNQGARHRMSNIDDKMMRSMLRMAHSAGVQTQGKFYVAGLARRGLAYRDPHAWVSTTDDILAVARRRNLEVEGVVNHKASEPPPPKRTRLAADIAAELLQKELKKPENAHVRSDRKRVRALREQIVAKHSRQPR